MRDLLSDSNNYDWPENYRYASDTVNDVSASCFQLALARCEFYV